MTDIRGIHYEVSKPVRNKDDGYYYQRRRQVDGQGNLVGTGEERIRLPNPNSLDGQYVPDIDWMKVGKLGGDVGQVGYGIIKRDPRAAARGVTGFAKDIQGGFYADYNSWLGTDKPWEQDDIPAPSGGGAAPGSGPAQPKPSPHTENVPMRRLVRLTSASPTPSAAFPNDIAASANGAGDAFTPLTSMPQSPQGPLSINDAYLEYLKRLSTSPPQTPSPDAYASSPPLAASDDSSFSGGLPGRLAALLGAARYS